MFLVAPCSWIENVTWMWHWLVDTCSTKRKSWIKRLKNHSTLSDVPPLTTCGGSVGSGWGFFSSLLSSLRPWRFPQLQLMTVKLLQFGQSGGSGLSVTPPVLVARSSDFATATMLLPLLPAMATQLRRLHAHRSPPINHSARILPVQVDMIIHMLLFWRPL